MRKQQQGNFRGGDTKKPALTRQEKVYNATIKIKRREAIAEAVRKQKEAESGG